MIDRVHSGSANRLIIMRNRSPVALTVALAAAVLLGMLSAVPANGAELVAHWTFDKDIQDAFGATTTPFAGAAITRSDAKVGPGCLALKNSYLVVDPTPSVDTPEFTMAFWIYYDSSYQKHTLRQTGRADDAFETGYDGEQLLLYVKGQTPSWNSLYQPVKMDEWVHYAYVYKDGKLTAYENAIQVYQRSIDLSGRKDKQLIIGAGGGVLKNEDYYRQYALKGKIDDLRIYDGALDRAAIQATVPAQLTGIRLADANPENNTDPNSYTNQTEISVTFSGGSGPHKPTVHLAADPELKTGRATETWTAERNTFGYSLSGPDGVKTVYARLEMKPGEYGAVVSANITLDTVPPRVESVDVNGGKPHTTTAHVGLSIAASDGGGAMKARVRDNGSEWSGWKEFLAHLSHRLHKENGKHTLEVQVCDNAGNVSPDVVADSITLELVPSLREHRNLYNGDFGVFFWNAEMWQPEGGRYTAKAIHRFVDRLADNGVDTFVINPNSQVAWYPSKAIPTVLDGYVRDDPSVPASNWWCHDLLNPALDLKEAGVDPLAEAIRQCRRRGISPWVSVRMNDPHLQHPYLQCPLHKDPKYRLDGLLNYEQREVRDYYFALIRELVNDYDIDGLELDWLRCPTCCRRDASAETIAMMTDWFGEIRKLTQATAARRGKALYFGMRIPANYRLLPKIGIDVQGMARDGMLDFLCPSNFMQTTWDMPHDELRKVFGKNVAVYGVTELWINETMVWSEKLKRQIAPYNNASPPALRGNAAGKLVLGADGIVQYNFFCGDQSRKYDKVPGVRSVYSGLRDLHDLESLRGQTKHYSLCCNLRNYGPYDFGLPMPLPVTLKPNERRTFRLPMCAESAERGLKLIVQVVVEKTDADANVAVTFNKSKAHADGDPTRKLLFPMGPALHHVSKYQAYNYRFGVNEIIEGWNEIVLTNSGSQSARIVSLELAVQRRSGAQE